MRSASDAAGLGDLLPLFVMVGVVASLTMLPIVFLHHADAAFTTASEVSSVRTDVVPERRPVRTDPDWRTGGEIRLVARAR